MLRAIAATDERGRRYPSFSGYVSHEFEAADDAQKVRNSVAELRELLVTA
jgi:hypothetical protein